jgi:hypothetical protein
MCRRLKRLQKKRVVVDKALEEEEERKRLTDLAKEEARKEKEKARVK